MSGKLVFYLYYYEDENLFTDDDGHVVYDIFDLITPQDLFLFRHDNGFNVFTLRTDQDILVEIVPIPDEVCGLQEIPPINLGDDYERIERYMMARAHGYLWPYAEEH